ncbi:MAG TPA: adenylate/guanylate cyclase domain-containing protein [Candidatus Uhrbacteria bacterium]|nr:adenylate/guanylate cyclase domain-containing protein [Candidatus Uhrbacteria bacterium]
MKKGKKSYSFRGQLMLLCFLLVIMMAVPVMVFEIQRPWQALNQLITQSKMVVSNLQEKFDPEELAKINNFAAKITDYPNQNEPQYLTWAFGLLLEDDMLPSEENIRQILAENEIDINDFDYDQLKKAFRFWQKQFFNEPGLIFIFRKYKKEISGLVESVNATGFSIDDTYVMADNGQDLYFILDGSAWHDSTYPGQKYDVIANDCPYFRAYLQKGPGFDHDPTHHIWGILPKFNTDQWGTWFSVWLAQKNHDNYNVFALDLDAQSVKDMMLIISGSIMIIAIIIILAVIIASVKLSNYFAKPIQDLVSGTEAVSQGDFNFRVPISGNMEFTKLINFFNQMVVSLKERLNMKQTLEKLLSEELAEQVAKHGLVLGGQKAEVTILFTDFAGFTPNTRNMPPEEVVKLLNEYFSELIPIIKKWGGLPDKYIGDSIIAIFGAPVRLENHAENAVCAAIEMQLKIRQINDWRKKNNQQILEMRVGLNSGQVIAGAIGSDLKLEYTAIGETTNLANRMESMAAIGHILIAENTYQLIKRIFFEGISIDFAKGLKFKGYDMPVAAYNLYIHNTDISKKEEFAGTNDYYHYSEADHGLKTKEDLAETERSLYAKFVKIQID